LNFEKIPNYSGATRLGSAGEGEWTATIDADQSHLPGLAYLAYKLAYIPAMVLTVVLLLRKRIDGRIALLFAPLLGLWPVVAITFPDTRFKLAAEVILVPGLIVGVLACWTARRNGSPVGGGVRFSE
jgi:hypothetical protein